MLQKRPGAIHTLIRIEVIISGNHVAVLNQGRKGTNGDLRGETAAQRGFSGPVQGCRRAFDRLDEGCPREEKTTINSSRRASPGVLVSVESRCEPFMPRPLTREPACGGPGGPHPMRCRTQPGTTRPFRRWHQSPGSHEKGQRRRRQHRRSVDAPEARATLRSSRRKSRPRNPEKARGPAGSPPPPTTHHRRCLDG